MITSHPQTCVLTDLDQRLLTRSDTFRETRALENVPVVDPFEANSFINTMSFEVGRLLEEE